MKKLFRFFAVAVVSLGSIPTVAAFTGGSGTVGDPYLISSLADMNLLSDSTVTGQTTGRYYKLTQNLITQFDTVRFSIGVKYGTINPFEGYFDGGGYKVGVNITTVETASGTDFAGLFAAVNNAVIHDLGVTGSIDVTGSGIIPINVGGVCARVMANSHIYECYNEASITAQVVDSVFAGGICGVLMGQDTITNCFNKANIYGNSQGKTVAVAGICGTANDSYIAFCYNIGDIAGHIEPPQIVCATAGIAAGGNSLFIKNCFAANANIEQNVFGSILTDDVRAFGGRITIDGVSVDSCFASATMKLNGQTISSLDHTNKHGMDVAPATVLSSNFIYNTLQWDRTVWCMTRPTTLNKGYPLLFNMKFNVLYEPNGGIGVPFTEVLAYGDALRWHSFGPPDASKAFLGWAESPTGTGKQYADGAPFTGDKDLVLYAKWGASPSVFSFSFREDPMLPGGKFAALNMTTNAPVTSGGTVQPSNRVRFTITPNDGYEVGGCFINGNSVGVISLDTVFVVNENTVVVVSFQMKNYTVVHHSELGTTPPNGSYTVNTPYQFPIIPSTPTDTFLGWYNNMDLTGALVNDGLLGSGNKEYWAKWARRLPFTEDFETSSANVLTGWSLANNSGLNSWHIGAGAGAGGSQGAYITLNQTGAYAYDASSATTVHLFCNLDVVSGDTILVSFDWNGTGVPNHDYMDVYFVNSATTVPRSASLLPAADKVGSFYGANAWTHETLLLRVDNQNKDRLVFTWRNDGVSGAEHIDPIAIDNVTVSRPDDVIVVYDTDGGSVIPNDTLRQGMAVTRPNNPTKPGYVFSDWTIDNISYAFAAPLLHDTTLTAKWLPRAYNITYELDGGSFSTDHTERYYITDATIVFANQAPPEKPSYAFTGWTNAAGIPVTSIPAGSVGDTILYALWDPKPEPITYVWNHGIPTIAQPTTYTPNGVVFIHPAEHDTYPDTIHFVGWYDNEGMTDTLITSLPTGALGPKTLYAKWARCAPFTETFEAAPYDSIGYWTFENGTQPNFWLVGNATNRNGNKSVYITTGDEHLNEYDKSKTSVAHLYRDVVLPSQNDTVWKFYQYYREINIGGGNVGLELVDSMQLRHGTTYTLSFDWKGYGETTKDRLEVFMLDSSAIKTNPIAGSPLVAAPNIHLLGTYNQSTGWKHERIILPHFTDTLRSRFVFSWKNDNSNGSQTPVALDNIRVDVSDDMTVNFDPVPVGATDPRFGNLNAAKLDTVIEGCVIAPSNLPQDPVTPGYVFNGWYDDDGVVFDPTLPVFRNISLHAKWTPLKYNIFYELDGGTNPDDAIYYYTTDAELRLKNGSEYVFKPTKEGYNFRGWTDTVPAHSTVEVTNIRRLSIGDTVLRATWNPILYTIHYQDGTTDLENADYYISTDALDLLVPPDRPDYRFDGWVDNPELIGTAITSLPPGTIGNKQYWARWIAQLFNETFDTNATIAEWHPVNDVPSKYNHWVIGAGARANNSARGAYISDNADNDYRYNPTDGSVVHLWRTVGFRASNDTTFTLAFDWECLGFTPPGTNTKQDYFEVFLLDSSAIKTNPIAGSPLVAAPNIHLLGTYNQSTGWKHERIILPHFTDTLRSRFVFSWKNDNSNGSQTPVALDNIRVDVSDDMTVNFDPVPVGATDPRFGNLNAAKLDTVIEGCVIAPSNLPQDPVTPGYVFNGWYDDDGVVFDPTLPVFRNISLHAKWTPLKYNIFYELDGGTNPDDAIYYYTTDAELRLKNGSEYVFKPTKEGYNFRGWTDTVPAHSTVEVTNIRRLSIGDTVLRATWNPILYTIHYQDGTTDLENADYYISTDALDLLVPPDRPDYRFDGWVDNPELIGTAITSLPPGTIGNKQYWARWIAQLFNETFDTNATIAEWHPVNDVPSKYNHWVIGAGARANNSARGAYISDNADNDYRYNPTDGSVVHLWRTVGFRASNDTTFTLAFDWECLGFTPPGTNTKQDYFEVFLLDEDKGQPVAGTALIPANGIVRLGSYNERATWTNEVVIIPKEVENSTKTLVFTWRNAGSGGTTQPVAIDNVSVGRSKVITLTLDTLPNEPHYDVIQSLEGLVISEPSPPQRIGYNFGGWYAGDVVYDFTKPLLRTTTLTAQWTPRICSIRYYMDGGRFVKVSDSIVSFKPTDELTLRQPVRTDGYAFVGWYTAPRDGVNPKQVSVIKRGSTQDLDLYAWWARTYNIHFELNQGNPLRDTVYTIDSRFKLPSAVRAGYVFSNWYEYDDQSQVDSVVGVKLAALGQLENKTYKAKWTPIEYPISYHLNGGINPLDSFKVYTIEAEVVLKKPTRPGYSFAGWYTNADLTGTETQVIPVGSTGAVSVWAKWNTIPYRLTYVFAPGENPTQNPSIYTTDHDTRLEPATRRGYTFMGWHYNAALTNLINPDLVTIPQGTVGDTVLYAKWELTRFPITYVLDGGSFSAPNDRINHFTCDRDTILKAPVKQGFNFLGWYFSPAMLGDRCDTIKAGAWFSPLTAYAKWQRALRVLFDSQGGNLFDPIEGLSTGDKIPTPLESPVRMDEETGKYYYFGGWFREKECITPWNFDTDVVTGNTRLYAWWVVFKDGFEADRDELFFDLDEGWVNKSAGQRNKWYIGEAASFTGTQSAYISDNDRDNAYTFLNDGGSIVHLYRDIVFGTSTRGAYTLSFDWRCMGEESHDYMQVYLTDVSVEPRAGREISSFALGRGRYNGKHEWQHETITLSNYFGTTQRLIFTWVNDAKAGQNTPIAIDNVIIVASELDFEAGPPVLSEGEGSTDVSVVATSGVQIYPNPAKDVAVIRNAAGNTVSIFNERGSVVFEKVITSNEERLSIKSWAPGIYLVRITEKENLISTLKLIKE
ncbi:hypothetical protein AGMMS49982_05580 [Bacteroidia bacterium]|nr:hypothetical protein AGMMS49982_05580 [Bacteroidia bacterium]